MLLPLVPEYAFLRIVIRSICKCQILIVSTVLIELRSSRGSLSPTHDAMVEIFEFIDYETWNYVVFLMILVKVRERKLKVMKVSNCLLFYSPLMLNNVVLVSLPNNFCNH